MPSLTFKEILVTQDRDRRPAQSLQRGQSVFVFAQCVASNEQKSHQSLPYTVSIEGFDYKDAVKFVTLSPGTTIREELIYAGVPVISPSTKMVNFKIKTEEGILQEASVEVN
jgi:hypothetical protein